MGGLIHKSSNNLMASSSTKENLNLSKINFNFNLNKSSFGGKKKKSTNHVLFQRGSKITVTTIYLKIIKKGKVQAIIKILNLGTA